MQTFTKKLPFIHTHTQRGKEYCNVSRLSKTVILGYLQQEFCLFKCRWIDLLGVHILSAVFVINDFPPLHSHTDTTCKERSFLWGNDKTQQQGACTVVAYCPHKGALLLMYREVLHRSNNWTLNCHGNRCRETNKSTVGERQFFMQMQKKTV